MRRPVDAIVSSPRPVTARALRKAVMRELPIFRQAYRKRRARGCDACILEPSNFGYNYRSSLRMLVPPSARLPSGTLARMSQSRFLRKYLGRPYLRMNIWIWRHLPAFLASWRAMRRYGCHLQSLIQLWATRRQAVGTFFFRNRPELELLIRLLGQKLQNSTVNVAVLACSKGAEVYSISY